MSILTRSKIILMVFVLVTNLLAVNAYAKRPKSCPIKNTTDFVYYSGSGASSLSQSWMVHFLDWWKAQDPDIDYMDLSAAEVAACDMTSFPNLAMYIQPGGNAYLAQRSLRAGGKSRINAFLDSGGSYFGACAGWFFAAGDYVWQDNYYDHANLLGAYPVAVEGSIREIADYDAGSGYAVTQLDTGHSALYWGGPTIGYEYTAAESVAGLVEARFQYRGLPAVVRYNNMLLTSVHLEAYENDGFTGLATADREANYRYLAHSINKTAGTGFIVPGDPDPAPKQCADGQDNDGDSLVDMNDPGCLSASDDDESDPSTDPDEAFFDVFEEGFTWTVSGTGRPWGIRTDHVLDGSFSAGVKRTGAGNPSFMEHLIDLSAYSSATFEYARKLRGLDAADDFSAEYLDGGWHAVEILGKGRENGGFVIKSFNIPTTATAIRFMCEAGAVSEGCWVDNVKIIGVTAF